MSTGASYNRHVSEQDVRTPRNFLNAVEKRFGPIEWDLACTDDNCVCRHGWTPENDSISIDWNIFFGSNHETLWLNPPFGNINKWAKKCEKMRERPGWTLLLVPASVGARWWFNHIEGKAMIYHLAPRIKFVGHRCAFPKDLALCAYGFGAHGHTSWRWRDDR